MDAITLLCNQANHHRLMQIDRGLLAKAEELPEGLFDARATGLCKNRETTPWQEAKSNGNSATFE